MKKLLLVLTLTATMSQAFAAAGFLVATSNLVNPEQDAGIGVGSLSTTTTTSVYASPIAGLVVFLDGEQAINLASAPAQELIESAYYNLDAGIELSEDEQAILTMVESHN